MSLPPLYDTFLIREPLRDDPFAVTHNPSDIPTLIEVYSKSISYFTDRNRERAVERLQYELALLYIREQKWSNALPFLLAVYQGNSWRRDGWWNLLALLREQVSDVARACGDAELVLRAEWEGLCDCECVFEADRVRDRSNVDCGIGRQVFPPNSKSITISQGVLMGWKSRHRRSLERW